MDLIITAAIVILLIAIILGTLRRGIQSVISFALLGLLAAFVVVRVSDGSLALGLFNPPDSSGSLTAIKAFDTFTQTVNPDALFGSRPGVDGNAPGDGTNGTPGQNGTRFGDATTPGDGTGSNPGVDRTAPGSDAGAREGVRAWW